MAKVLLINGSPHKEGCTCTALSEVERTLRENGIATEMFWIGTSPVQGCTGCGQCRETGICVFGDAVVELSSRLDEFSGIILGSPVYFAGPSGQLCSFCDRLFHSNPGAFAGKLAAAVVSCRRGGASEAFARLNMYFGTANMIIVGSQYWNQVHGFTSGDVRKDRDGMPPMRTLGKNMAWLLRCIEDGAKHRIGKPEYEPWTPTHFIMPGCA